MFGVLVESVEVGEQPGRRWGVPKVRVLAPFPESASLYASVAVLVAGLFPAGAHIGESTPGRWWVCKFEAWAATGGGNRQQEGNSTYSH